MPLLTRAPCAAHALHCAPLMQPTHTHPPSCPHPRSYDGHNGGWSPALTINKVALSLRRWGLEKREAGLL